MTPEQFAKLPKFAQEEITTLRRQRDIAVSTLATWEDNQTVSSIWHTELISDGENVGPTFRRRYINGAHCIKLMHAGVELEVSLSRRGSGEFINLRWEAVDRSWTSVTMQPQSFQNVHLFNSFAAKTETKP